MVPKLIVQVICLVLIDEDILLEITIVIRSVRVCVTSSRIHRLLWILLQIAPWRRWLAIIRGCGSNWISSSIASESFQQQVVIIRSKHLVVVLIITIITITAIPTCYFVTTETRTDSFILIIIFIYCSYVCLGLLWCLTLYRIHMMNRVFFIVILRIKCDLRTWCRLRL